MGLRTGEELRLLAMRGAIDIMYNLFFYWNVT